MSIFDRIDATGRRISDWAGDSGSRFTFVFASGIAALIAVIALVIVVCIAVFGDGGMNCPPGTTHQSYTQGYGKQRTTYEYCLAQR